MIAVKTLKLIAWKVPQGYDRETFADTMLTCLEELKAKHV